MCGRLVRRGCGFSQWISCFRPIGYMENGISSSTMGAITSDTS